MHSYKPEKIYIDAKALASSFSTLILNKFPDVEKIVIENKEEQTELQDRYYSLPKRKKILHLKYFQGSPFKLCPGFSADVVCCNYYVIDIIENCPLECTYCILQAFLNKPTITFHVNVDEMMEKTSTIIKNSPNRFFRVGTGEHSDSLALDHIFQVNAYLVDIFAKLPNATLELKTKTDSIDALLGLNHRERTVVSWSLNPPEIIKKNELKTASLEKRLKSARTLVKEGYKVAFHFDPVIHFPQWRRAYQQTVEMMFEAVAPENIAWISLGALRFIPSLKQIAEKRFSGISIFCNEFIAAPDGKMRYLKPIRKELLGTISGWIKKAGPKIPLYYCMETKTVWQQTLQFLPSDPSCLEQYLNTTVF